MFTVSIETRFQASHRLALLDGWKEPVHEHNWSIRAEAGSETLDNMGLVIDFHRLKAMVDNVVGQLDNRQLEEIDYFQQNRSSAEGVARYIYEKLEPGLPKGVKLVGVTVTEEQGCSAKFAKRR